MTKPPLDLASASDRLGLMETFVRIVEAGSLSAAATQLRTTQPTVSRRLQALERTLGVRLLRRSTHAMKPTDDGLRCYQQAKELLAGWETFTNELRGTSEEPSGRLRVVVPHAFGQEQLIAPLAGYLARHPDVSVEWLLHDRPPDFVADGIDCAIRVGGTQDPSVVALRIAEVPRIVVAAPSLLVRGVVPRSPRELGKLPWLALTTFYRDEIVLTHTTSAEKTRVAIQPRIATDSLYALRSAALLGVGAGIVSRWVVSADLAAGRLVHVAPAWRAAPLPVYVVYPPGRYQPARLKRFIEVMRAALPAVDGMVATGARGAERRQPIE